MTIAQVVAGEPPDTSSPTVAIPLSAPRLAGNEWRYVKECLDSGWVSSASGLVERFEWAVAAYVGAPHAVATVNGTAALHTALRLVGVRPEEEVIVPTLTFIAPVNAVRYCGAHPVFMDADPDTWQLDAAKLEDFLSRECRMRRGCCVNRRSGRRIRAIVAVHLLGLACDIDRIVEAARRCGMRLVEDAAEGMGVRSGGRHVGTFGDVGVLSFNGNKIMTAGGGGMLVTQDSQLAAAARYLTTQAKDDSVEHVHRQVGYNYRLSGLQAALGLAQLEQLDDFISRKRAIARTYEEALRGAQDLSLMPAPPCTSPTYWLYTVLLSPRTRLADRQALVSFLNERGIGARPLWHPVHALPPYRACQAHRVETAMRLYVRGVSLPSGPGLTDAELVRCVEVLRDGLALRQGGRP